MPATVRIDMVSDVTCPWSAIGLFTLLHAQRTLQGELHIHLHLQPLEQHPGLGPDGVERAQYQPSPRHVSHPSHRCAPMCWADVRLHGLAVGLEMGAQEPPLLYRTLDAHRLLQWAESHGPGHQVALAQQLVHAYFGRAANMADHAVLADAAAATGLDRAAALAYLAGHEDAQAVRDAESFYRGMGIQAVPTFIFNHRQLLRGCQTPQGFVQALRQAAAATPQS